MLLIYLAQLHSEDVCHGWDGFFSEQCWSSAGAETNSGTDREVDMRVQPSTILNSVRLLFQALLHLSAHPSILTTNMTTTMRTKFMHHLSWQGHLCDNQIAFEKIGPGGKS